MKRTRNVFNPSSGEPYPLSRSKLENFLKCPRCFYLDRRLGINTPSIPSFTLNSAVDLLLKKEFDIYRIKKEPHPSMKEHGIHAIPFEHPELEDWRNNFKGVRVHHQPSNFLFFGAVDDLWITDDKEIIVVDYKSTSKDGEVTLDGIWQEAYKRQMEIYQWLLSARGFSVHDIGYFFYVNGRKSEPRFDLRLNFDLQLIPYKGSRDWVDDALVKAHKTLESDFIPKSSTDCDYCNYRKAASKVEDDA